VQRAPVAKSNKLWICTIAVVQRLAAKGVVVMVMICAGKLCCHMLFGRIMFDGNRVGGIHGPDTRGAMIRQIGAVTHQCGAARAGCCSVTAQSATRAVTTSASTHMSAAPATTAAARVAASATATATATATRGSAAAR
jgi:hypothetical protein